jgi:Transposase DDE domain
MIIPPVAEPRLQRRYIQMVMGQLSPRDQLAAGIHSPPGTLAEGFAAVQGAWRFNRNERVTLPMLCGPLVGHAVSASAGRCDRRVLVPLDWSNLHFDAGSKEGLVELACPGDMGYELLTAVAVSDRDGAPIAPVCLEMRAADGLHTTREKQVAPVVSVLDGLAPVMDHVSGLGLGKKPVFIIDKEADSIGHYRNWHKAGHEFLVRAKHGRKVMHDGRELPLREIAAELKPVMKESRQVLIKGKPATQFVAETTVILTRPAYPNRTGKGGKKKRPKVEGPALPLRLIVAEVRDKKGKVLALWTILTNLPASVATASTIALWYYWRWRIESYHKLLKSAGHQLERWMQETAAAFIRRLLIAAMASVVAWQIARDDRPEVKPLRDLLVRLSGRQTDRARNKRGFTEPMLLAGLAVLVPMLALLETTDVEEIRAAAGPVLAMIRNQHPQSTNDTG